jgi:hypothetical protein
VQRKYIGAIAIVTLSARAANYIFVVVNLFHGHLLRGIKIVYLIPPIFVFLLLQIVVNPILSMGIRIQIATLLNNEVLKSTEMSIKDTSKETSQEIREGPSSSSSYKEYDEIISHKISKNKRRAIIISIFW